MDDRAGMDDEVFRALADPSRRDLLDRLNQRNGQTLRELCTGRDMARQSVSKHLGILEAAGLVTTTWRGREKLHFLNAAPINAIADRWISRYDRERARALADLTTALEAKTMTKTAAPSFVYVTYIATTAERLWEALTTPEFTVRYWAGVRLESDWKPGSLVRWVFPNGVVVDEPEQVVLESEPGRRLVYRFHGFPPEYIRARDWSPEFARRISAEPFSTVTFDIEQLQEKVRLTVTHDGFLPDSEAIKLISRGWPSVLSGLKTLLETGRPLPDHERTAATSGTTCALPSAGQSD